MFGVTLTGLAMLQSSVAQDPHLMHTVLAATIIGSHAPDFDTLARVKGYAAYLRVHRGVTHSLPALLLWPLVISLPLAWSFGIMGHWSLLYEWSLAAVVLHVLLDAFNAYGVQCLRPLNISWHHLDVLTLFEPFLFAIHSAGLLYWIITGANPSWMFAIIYFISFIYIAIRIWQHRLIVQLVLSELKREGSCHVLPSLHWFRWQFVMETSGFFYTGTVLGKKVTLQDVYAGDASHPIIRATMSTDGVRAFLHFAQRIHVCFKERQDGYEVQWRDVRFWYNHQLPFGVDVTLDRDLKVTGISLGWRKKAWHPPFV